MFRVSTFTATASHFFCFTRGRYALPVGLHTACAHGQALRPVHTGAFLTPVLTGRMYGPYVRVVRIGLQSCRHVSCLETSLDMVFHVLTQFYTLRYDTMILTCAQKLTYSQLNLPHGTKQKRITKKLKIKTEMLRRNGPVIKPWSQCHCQSQLSTHTVHSEYTKCTQQVLYICNISCCSTCVQSERIVS